MKPMMAGTRMRLAALAGDTRLFRRLVRVSGKGESAVEDRNRSLRWLASRPPIETTIRRSGQVELHLVLQSVDTVAASAALERAVTELSEALRDVVSTDGMALEVVGDLLRARSWRVALAESCTGGPPPPGSPTSLEF
jgi:nicotinamide-nucleotide amidase